MGVESRLCLNHNFRVLPNALAAKPIRRVTSSPEAYSEPSVFTCRQASLPRVVPTFLDVVEELPAIRFVWFCQFHCFSSRICHLFEQNPPVPIQCHFIGNSIPWSWLQWSSGTGGRLIRVVALTGFIVYVYDCTVSFTIHVHVQVPQLDQAV